LFNHGCEQVLCQGLCAYVSSITNTCLVCSAAAAAAVSTNQMSSSEMHGDDRKRSYALAPREAEHLIFNRMGASHNDAEYLIENQMSASRSDAEEERMCGDYCPL
jgi:hypothetical protein